MLFYQNNIFWKLRSWDATWRHLWGKGQNPEQWKFLSPILRFQRPELSQIIISLSNFDLVMFVHTFWNMEGGGGSIFLKQQLWNFLSSVFMWSLRRPAASIWTSWRLFIRGLHCYIVKISKYTHLHEINIFDEKNDFQQLKQENLKHTCLKHIIFNIFNVIIILGHAVLSGQCLAMISAEHWKVCRLRKSRKNLVSANLFSAHWPLTAQIRISSVLLTKFV